MQHHKFFKRFEIPFWTALPVRTMIWYQKRLFCMLMLKIHKQMQSKVLFIKFSIRLIFMIEENKPSVLVQKCFQKMEGKK